MITSRVKFGGSMRRSAIIFWKFFSSFLLGSSPKSSRYAVSSKPGCFASRNPLIYAMQYILCTDVRSLYTFRVSDEVQRELGMVMDRHRERYMEKRFRTLDILQAMTENV